MVGISTNLIHNKTVSRDVIPPINISTTYKYSEDPDDLVKVTDSKGSEDYFLNDTYFYSRVNHPTSELLEKALSKILDGHVVVYNSGLAAFFAALTYINPKKLVIGQAYHGCHGITKIFSRLNGLEVLDLKDPGSFDKLQKGDLVHLETPVNPHGLDFDISYYAELAHKKGALLMVDSTFAPPPLQYPFKHGADIIMHSATKYFGGHSDLLAGILVVRDKSVQYKLYEDRVYLATNIGNLESTLLYRSLKTFELRILKQSDNCEQLVKYLNDHRAEFKVLKELFHGSLQTTKYPDQITKHSPTFALTLTSEKLAKSLPSKLNYFVHATSLGGAESLIEWRALSDSSVDPSLLRVSVGLENIDDLIEDFKNALLSLE
ncbi:hypothetical protein PSN45_004781 [Yamadazyma tenuis]|uniref:Cystathionine gamma-synthase n=1 Tax=Candida tenuis (strain ATCC 10573 / BCRC 21748 / CBS 615 / JCM 9827 / NBRC 10315 / NRRL Y-1498 / VKM Y-70) TaxID=590646 RepID=G3B1L0_CANTC|nr:uncharacterized protein CANTEDRAFT_103687 [Yamadazyma tenuis ATCC 10573]EGV64471.1 hypothetical protein CANTEDRAFT_103687 [Yamadazyma tenuis ATCC 10573]WEJ97232.1 hypothetical protein PSN45_004781 [Yamadazyma tenuis]